MADPASFGNHERDVEQALIALKKGTQLIKYGWKGKPKFCPFRLPTAVFRRYLRPEKDYLSLSLLYNNGERSLDLICKDKVEAEVWFIGLKALTSMAQRKRFKSNIDGGLYSDVKRLKQKCEDQDVMLQKSEKKAQEAALLVVEESSKRDVAKEVMKSLAAQPCTTMLRSFLPVFFRRLCN